MFVDRHLDGAHPDCTAVNAEIRLKPLVAAVATELNGLLEDITAETMHPRRDVVLSGPLGGLLAAGEAHLIAHHVGDPDPFETGSGDGLGEDLIQCLPVTRHDSVFQGRGQVIRQLLGGVEQVLAGIREPGIGKEQHQPDEHEDRGNRT